MEEPKEDEGAAPNAETSPRSTSDGSADLEMVRLTVAGISDPSIRAAVQTANEIAEASQALVRPETLGLIASLQASPFFNNAYVYSISQQVADASGLIRRGIGASALQAIAEYQRSLNAQLTRTVEVLRSWRPYISEFVSEQLRSFLEARSIFHWLLASELAERGWWLVPTWSGSLLTELSGAMLERRGRRVVDAHVLQYYRASRHQTLGRTIRNWTEPEYARRRIVFREAFTDYRARRFRRAIASLTPHVEGVVKDFLLAERLITASEARRGRTPELVATYVASDRGHAALPGAIRKLQALYSEFTWGITPTSRGVSRHPITHGAVVPPNSEIESLQLFLMLETLHYFLADLRRRRAARSA